MKKAIKIGTIIFHSIIVVGIGHGIGFLFFDFFSIPATLLYGFESSNGEFKMDFGTIGLLSSTGKIVLIISLFIKSNKRSYILEFIGVLLLWISIFILNKVYNTSILFWTVIPFIICIIILTFMIINNGIKLIKN